MRYFLTLLLVIPVCVMALIVLPFGKDLLNNFINYSGLDLQKDLS